MPARNKPFVLKQGRISCKRRKRKDANLDRVSRATFSAVLFLSPRAVAVILPLLLTPCAVVPQGLSRKSAAVVEIWIPHRLCCKWARGGHDRSQSRPRPSVGLRLPAFCAAQLPLPSPGLADGEGSSAEPAPAAACSMCCSRPGCDVAPVPLQARHVALQDLLWNVLQLLSGFTPRHA